MADHLLDTGILIRHVRHRPGFHDLLTRLNREGHLYISVMSRVEVLRGMREHERERTFFLLDSLRTHPLDRETADLAGEILRVWQGRGINLGAAYAIIGASALQLQAVLATLNPRHFPMPELSIVAVDEEANLSPFNP